MIQNQRQKKRHTEQDSNTQRDGKSHTERQRQRDRKIFNNSVHPGGRRDYSSISELADLLHSKEILVHTKFNIVLYTL